MNFYSNHLIEEFWFQDFWREKRRSISNKYPLNDHFRAKIRISSSLYGRKFYLFNVNHPTYYECLMFQSITREFTILWFFSFEKPFIKKFKIRQKFLKNKVFVKIKDWLNGVWGSDNMQSDVYSCSSVESGKHEKS